MPWPWPRSDAKGIHDLICLGALKAVATSKADLSGHEPGDGDALGERLAVPLEEGQTSVRGLGFESHPWLGILKGRHKATILILQTSVGQQEPHGLSAPAEVEICHLD